MTCAYTRWYCRIIRLPCICIGLDLAGFRTTAFQLVRKICPIIVSRLDVFGLHRCVVTLPSLFKLDLVNVVWPSPVRVEAGTTIPSVLSTATRLGSVYMDVPLAVSAPWDILWFWATTRTSTSPPRVPSRSRIIMSGPDYPIFTRRELVAIVNIVQLVSINSDDLKLEWQYLEPQRRGSSTDRQLLHH